MNTFVELDMKIVISILNKIYSQQIDRMLERIVIYLFSLNKQSKPSLLFIMITLRDLNLIIMISVIYV